MRLILAIVADDSSEAANLLESSPSLARQSLQVGATRQTAAEFFFEKIAHYLYAGDTPLHAAAAGYRLEIAKQLVIKGADVSAANRRGAQPLHYAADGGPGLPGWNRMVQAETISFLIESGADPNAVDDSGVAPIHRAVRQRCASAVEALLSGGARVRLKNKNGSTPLHLAVQNTGKGGSGTPESKELQRQIIKTLLKAGADPDDRDAHGKTVRQSVLSDWIGDLLPRQG